MSNASGQCRFDSDGLIMHFEYIGSVDACEPALWATAEERNDHWRKGVERECACGKDEPVRLACNYGWGSHWPGRACRHCRVITAGIDAFESEPQEGAPSWWPEADDRNSEWYKNSERKDRP